MSQAAWTIQARILFTACPHRTDNPKGYKYIQIELSTFALRPPKESLGWMKGHENQGREKSGCSTY